MRVVYWLVVNTIYVFLKGIYGIKIKGAENIPDGPAIIAPNHISFLDPPIVGSACPKELHYLANARLFKHPLFGWFIRKLNSHPVNTGGNDTQALKTVLHLLQEGKRVLIFPEGIRSHDGTLHPLKMGCAMLSLHTGCPIIPTYIKGAYEIWPRTQKKPNLKGKIEITFGAPLLPSSIHAASKKEAQILLTEELKQRLIALSKE